MNRKQLEREGKKWVDKELISDAQLESILHMYKGEDKSYILIILAALLISISIIVFVFSDWAQIANISRIIIMLLMMTGFYLLGFYYQGKNPSKKWGRKRLAEHSTYSREQIIGNSLLIIGYVTFGATLWLALTMYNVQLMSAWPFFIWSLAGILLYMILPNHYLLGLTLLITIYGQIHSGLNYATFNYMLFLLLFFVFFHYVYHRGNTVLHYIFAVGLSINILVLVMNEFNNFYWFLFFTLFMYALSNALPKKLIKRQMLQITTLTILMYKVYETVSVQESYIMEHLSYQPSFFILYSFLFLGVLLLMLIFNRKELITLILFVPVFFIPYAHVLIIISLFIYSIYWIIYGFQKDATNKMVLGIFTFLLSIFTVIVQYAWETINKSLFFLVAGLILFGISLLIERRRQDDEGGNQR